VNVLFFVVVSHGIFVKSIINIHFSLQFEKKSVTFVLQFQKAFDIFVLPFEKYSAIFVLTVSRKKTSKFEVRETFKFNL
jgi:hypothetical protein